MILTRPALGPPTKSIQTFPPGQTNYWLSVGTLSASFMRNPHSRYRFTASLGLALAKHLAPIVRPIGCW